VSYLDVYVGRLDDPDFRWEGGDWNGNVPKRVSPFFPPIRGPETFAFIEVHRRLRDRRFVGKQTDWGGWVVPASKATIGRFVADLYDDNPHYGADSAVPHLVQRLADLRRYVSTIEDDGRFAIVATEL
jgi:hypothetical protein